MQINLPEMESRLDPYSSEYLCKKLPGERDSSILFLRLAPDQARAAPRGERLQSGLGR